MDELNGVFVGGWADWRMDVWIQYFWALSIV
jgi:hypothetical protein